MEAQQNQVAGSTHFHASADEYDAFMGRYSIPLAKEFARAAGVGAGMTVLDVGCGPGALSGVLTELVGADRVRAIDPSPTFVADFHDRHPGIEVARAAAEDLPLADDSVDAALAQLVLHFVSDAPTAAAEMRRVTRPGGRVGATVWDFDQGMEMLRLYWDAALTLDPDAPDEARTLRFGRPGEIADLFRETGLRDIEETTLTVSSTYSDLGVLIRGFGFGVGPAGAHFAALSTTDKTRIREEVDRRLGFPRGEITLRAMARCAVGTVPAAG